MNPHQMTGLEMMQAFQKGLVPAPGISKTMGMGELVEAEFGRIVMRALADERHTNPLGGVHGGFAATVLDSVTGCSAHSVLAAGEGYGTTDLAIKMCRPVPFNTQLIAEGKVINIGKNLIISEGYLRDEEGKLYAHATATNMILRAKSA